MLYVCIEWECWRGLLKGDHRMTERDFVTTISYFMITVVSLLIITVILLALILWAVW